MGVLCFAVASCGNPQVKPSESPNTSKVHAPKTSQSKAASTTSVSSAPHPKERSAQAEHPKGQLLKTPGEHGQVRITCPNPALPTAPDPRKVRLGANAKVHIHATGIGDIHIGEPVPKSINEIEGRPYDADFKKAVKEMDHYKAMAAGYYNMAGYPTIRLKQLDLMMTLAQEERVLSLSPGPEILTRKGTGVGSSLYELQQKYDRVHLSRAPEPYHCLVSVAAEPRLSFLFTFCHTACAGERAQKVTIGGANYDFMKQEWGTPHRYPLP